MTLPKMRTAPEAIKEIKELDPRSCLTLNAIRSMMRTGKIPVTYSGTKRLINLDLLIEHLYKDNTDTRITPNLRANPNTAKSADYHNKAKKESACRSKHPLRY